MSLSANPYVPGSSVGDTEAFFGRTELVGEIAQGLRRAGRYLLVLEGLPGSGRTSLLDELSRHLPALGEFKTVRFDVDPGAEQPLARVIQDLGAAISHACGTPRPVLGADPADHFAREWLPRILDMGGPAGRLVLLLDKVDLDRLGDERRTQARLLPFLERLLRDHGDRLGVVLARGPGVGDSLAAAKRIFSDVKLRRLGPLSLRETRGLVHLSQVNKSLYWTDAGAERVWELTGGHAYQVQHLCHRIWERHHHAGLPLGTKVRAEDVDAAVPQALVDAHGAFEALWAGLDPASRVVAGALAARGAPVPPLEFDTTLSAFGVETVTRHLVEARHTLRHLGLLDVEAEDLRFQGELLARWLREHKPRTAILADLDHIDPKADSRFRSAQLLLEGTDDPSLLQRVETIVGEVLHINPNHAGAVELRAEVLLRLGDQQGALVVLERLATRQPAVARPKIIPLLLELAEKERDDRARKHFLRRLLQVAPGHREGLRALQPILVREGRALEAQGKLGEARARYEAAGAFDEVARISGIFDARDIEAALARIAAAEAAGRIDEALEAATDAQAALPGGPFAEHIRRLDRRARLGTLYREGLGAVQQGDRDTAVVRLGEVIGIQPDYEDAARYLFQALHGRDPAAVSAPVAPRAVVPVWAFAAAVVAAVGLGGALVLPELARIPAPTVSVQALQAAPAPATAAPATAAVAPVAGAAAADPGLPAAAPEPAVPSAGSATEAPAAAPEPAAPAPAAATEAPTPTAAPEPAPAPAAAERVLTATSPGHRAGNPTALVAQGWRQLDEGDLYAAQQTFDQATHASPFDGAAWFGLGYTLEERGQLDRAATTYCKALDRAGGEVALVREIQGRLRAISRGCR